MMYADPVVTSKCRNIYVELLMRVAREKTPRRVKIVLRDIWLVRRDTEEGKYCADLCRWDGTKMGKTVMADSLRALRKIVMRRFLPYVPDVIEYPDNSNFLESWV